MRRIDTAACIVVPMALGAALRLAHLGFLAANDPLFHHPVVDSWFHSQEAQKILATGWTLPGSGAFYKPPLYSYLLAVLYLLFGLRGGGIVGRLVSIACGSLAVLLCGRIARRLGGPRAAWIAGLAAALYGTAVYMDAQLLQVSLVDVLALAACERLMAARASESPGRALAAGGAFLGLLAITRTDGLIVLVLASVWACWLGMRGRWPSTGPARAAALVLAPALLAIAPVTARNALLEKDPVIVSWNGGINLFMGNDPAFDQASGNWHPDFTWMRLYYAPGDLGFHRGSDHQRFFIGQTLRRARAEPLATLKIVASKTALLFSDYEISNNRRISESRAHSPLLRLLMAQWTFFALPFGLAFPLIAAGLVMARGRLNGQGFPLIFTAAAWAGISIAFFNTERYRLPAVLLLIPVAACGWSAMGWIRRTRTSSGKAPPSRNSASPSQWRIYLSAAFVAALAAAAGSATMPDHPTLPTSETLDLADVAEQSGDMDRALSLRLHAVDEDPSDPFARMRLGETLRRLGRHTEALAQYRAVADRSDLAADWLIAAKIGIAHCQFGLKHYEESAATDRIVLEADPDHPRTRLRPDFHLLGTPPLKDCGIRLNLCDALARAGKFDDAEVEARRVARECAASERLSAEAKGKIQKLTALRAAP